MLPARAQRAGISQRPVRRRPNGENDFDGSQGSMLSTARRDGRRRGSAAARPRSNATPGGRRPCSRWHSHCCRSSAAARCSRCGASTASAATTPRTRARWAPTPNRRAAVLLPEADATRSSSSRPARPPTTRTRRSTQELPLRDRARRRAGKSGGQQRPVDEALGLVYGYCDRPRHDAARPAARDGRPRRSRGRSAKSFDRSAPIGPDPSRLAVTGHLRQGRDHAEGQRREVKQNANLNQMIWSVAEQVSQPVAGLRADAGRHHLQRHARRTSGRSCRATLMEGFIAGCPERSTCA